MLRRPLHQEPVDDDRRQGDVNQDIPDRPAAFPGDLAAPEKQEPDARQQEHLQDLSDQNQKHMFILRRPGPSSEPTAGSIITGRSLQPQASLSGFLFPLSLFRRTQA